MKKLFTLLLILTSFNFSFAKKVKFAVDMTGTLVNVTGMHISGDFQTIAGFPGGDWNSASTPLTQEVADTNIYSIIVDIPAFTKYEYKFVNGDLFYEAEFVPVESRVGYNFNDNRWLYVDSIANDTTFVGNIVFAANAPAGKFLVRYLVDMQNQTSISGNGVHIAGDFQGWDPTTTRLYSFGGTIYEIIAYVDAGTYEYKFINGNATIDSEVVPSTCANNGNRMVVVSADIVLDAFCFGTCYACSSVGIDEISFENRIRISPNPASGSTVVMLDNVGKNEHLELMNNLGQVVSAYQLTSKNTIEIDLSNLNAGLYFIKRINSSLSHNTVSKLVIQ
jgi:hypothetical protein